MERYFKLIILFFLPLLIFSACTSGKQAYKRGDYFEAVVKSVDRLRKNPGHKKSRETLRKAYPRAQSYYYSIINNAKESNDQFKYSIVLETYQKLNVLYEEIQRSPGALKVIPDPQDYYSEIKQYRRKAAEERYALGLDALKVNNRPAAIEAYDHFVMADQYSPGYKDVRNKIAEARELATLKILVRQLSPPSVHFQISIEFFQDQVYDYLLHYNENEFIRFYTDRQKLGPPDQIMEIMFDDFVVGQTRNFSDTKEITRDSVVVGEVKLRDGKKKDVYGTVKASFTENRREVASSGLLSVRVMDAYSKQVINHQKFPGEFVWVSQWASFNGDERALTEEQLKITKLKPLPPPSPQQMFIEFCKPIYGQLRNHIRSYYRAI